MKCVEYKKNWQRELCDDEWEEFIKYSYRDETCNNMWKEYKNKMIDYDKLNYYEFSIYLQFRREKLLLNLVD